MHLRISSKILTLATREAPKDPHQPHLVPLPLLRTSWHRSPPLLFRQGLHPCQALGKAPICGLAHLILTIALRCGYPCLSLLYSRRKWGSDRLTDWQRTTQLMGGEAVVQTQTFLYHNPNTPTPHSTTSPSLSLPGSLSHSKEMFVEWGQTDSGAGMWLSHWGLGETSTMSLPCLAHRRDSL